MQKKILSEKETVLTKMYDLLLYLIPQLNKFPRSQKFLLADRIEKQILDIMEYLIEAYYTTTEKKQPILRRVNLELEKLRYLIRISHDLKHFSHQQYGFIAGRVLSLWHEPHPESLRDIRSELF